MKYSILVVLIVISGISFKLFAADIKCPGDDFYKALEDMNAHEIFRNTIEPKEFSKNYSNYNILFNERIKKGQTYLESLGPEYIPFLMDFLKDKHEKSVEGKWIMYDLIILKGGKEGELYLIDTLRNRLEGEASGDSIALLLIKYGSGDGIRAVLDVYERHLYCYRNEDGNLIYTNGPPVIYRDISFFVDLRNHLWNPEAGVIVLEHIQNAYNNFNETGYKQWKYWGDGLSECLPRFPNVIAGKSLIKKAALEYESRGGSLYCMMANDDEIKEYREYVMCCLKGDKGFELQNEAMIFMNGIYSSALDKFGGTMTSYFTWRYDGWGPVDLFTALRLDIPPFNQIGFEKADFLVHILNWLRGLGDITGKSAEEIEYTQPKDDSFRSSLAPWWLYPYLVGCGKESFINTIAPYVENKAEVNSLTYKGLQDGAWGYIEAWKMWKGRAPGPKD